MAKQRDKNAIFRQEIILKFIFFVIVLSYIPQALALDVNVQKLSNDIPENKDISFDIEISDYNYANYISIETNIVKSGNTPIFDLGELNEKYTGIDRYKQNIILDIPKDLSKFRIKLTGRSPSGIEFSNINGIEVAKFIDGDLKYYEIKLLGNNKEELGQKNRDIRTFRLSITEKMEFEKIMRDIDWKDLDELKIITRDMFEKGLVKDAKRLATALSKIRTPEDEWVPYRNNLKNALLAILVFIIFCIGIWIGRRQHRDGDESEIE